MSSKTDAFVKLGIVFSISLLSFSIGIFAGKKFSDNQHQLAALEPQKNSQSESREIASMPNAPSEGRSGAMTDDEIAKLAEEFVADDTVPAHGSEATEPGHEAVAAHGEVPAHTHNPAPAVAAPHGAAPAHQAETKAVAPRPSPATKTPPVTKHEEPSSAAKNIVEGKAPTATTSATDKKAVTREERLPSSLPKDVAQFAVGKFTVQVASYPQEAEAQKMASDLKGKGYSAFYIPANVKGQTYYRVSVGQFATQKEAQTYRSEFLAKSKVSSAIVQKISE